MNITGGHDSFSLAGLYLVRTAYYKGANQKLDSRLANPEIWNPSGFDGDSSF